MTEFRQKPLHRVPSRPHKRPTNWTPLEVVVPAEVETAAENLVSVREINARQINVAFQPIVEISSGRVFAQEALARCSVPGLESPTALFARAEREGACGWLGRAVREVAFARASGKRLFVNIHPRELSTRWLVRPDDPLYFHDSDVFLEITESTAFDYFELCMNVLKEVCSRSGAQLVVDDLGAGYSNLTRILELEPRVAKLDRSLVTKLDTDRRKQVLVRKLIELCNELGCRVVCEGIETIGELSAARDCGAQYAQGYLLARPADPAPEVVWPLAGQVGRELDRAYGGGKTW
jgi:EAL domain-containing protein (putative c-di-GMP-specific phosphodiesterase class I)